MTNSFRARRATALAATAAVVVAVLPQTAALSAPMAAAVPSAPAVSAAAVPKISGLTPALADVEGGTVVSIAGTGLKTTSAVTFGDQPAARIVVMSDTRVIAVAPPGTIGAVTLTVTTGGGVVTGKFGYRMSLSADFDTVTAGTSGGTGIPVTVTGGTVGATAAQFKTLKITATVGGVNAQVAYMDASHVRVVVPPATKIGSAVLRLVHDGFAGPESVSTVDYVAAVTSVSPAKVSTEGGATVRITGSGFLGLDDSDTSLVTFADVPAESFRVVSPTVIEAQVPAGTNGWAAVRVGDSLASAGARIAYRTPLSIDTAGDWVLKAGGGPVVMTVSGGVLGADAKAFTAEGIVVKSGGRSLPATYLDPTRLRVTLPMLAGEEATLQVVHDTIAGPPATITVAPAVVSLSATSGPLAGGKRVTVRVAGPGAATATDFKFGANAATCTGSASVFVCTVPPASQAGPVGVSFTSGSGIASRFTVPATFNYTDLD
ncbi:IPT/TIG domain-containing protein [Actinoplanes sp. NPDC051861]|uniref:IPT/TIG domain-containing protein n=1 Tax=Actinoplanes sp. NPDC051861 TaxID=3155170 RepID=UPI00341EB462